MGSVLPSTLTRQGEASRATPQANLPDHAEYWDKLRRRSRNKAGVYTEDSRRGPFGLDQRIGGAAGRSGRLRLG
jgi:hypothetical protein